MPPFTDAARRVVFSLGLAQVAAGILILDVLAFTMVLGGVAAASLLPGRAG